MLGTFSPQKEPYTYELEEETTPGGYFARGSYSARTKVRAVTADERTWTEDDACYPFAFVAVRG